MNIYHYKNPYFYFNCTEPVYRAYQEAVRLAVNGEIKFSVLVRR